MKLNIFYFHSHSHLKKQQTNNCFNDNHDNNCFFSDAHIVVEGNITVDKKTFTTDDFEDPNNTAAMQLLLIMQIIMHLVKKVGF